MNTRRILLSAICLMLPLALSGAPDQGTNQPPPAAALSGRPAVNHKLESIRLESVTYDNLPLSEVVVMLMDAARKLDPEKKGINFLIRQRSESGEEVTAPSAPAALDPTTGLPASTAAPERVDVGNIVIKVAPPLADVRLVDALDAIVTVADPPIKYSVEDYGVVFSPVPSDAPREEETPPSPSSNPLRQFISGKLERIHLDSIAYDNLPLGEVVLNLRDLARKGDPEKKGVNFMLNPTIPLGYLPGPGFGPDGSPLPRAERPDIGSIVIRIRPPLTYLRLVDALEAVVKVADHPMKYTIEDYGVVFSFKGPELPRGEEIIAFAFPGGTPRQFVTVQEQYKVDWMSVAEIPKEMENVHIPRVRINRESLSAMGHGNDVGTRSLGAVMSLYNQLWENRNELGRLVVKGDLTKPSIVMFVQDPAATRTPPDVKVKAFNILDISDSDRAKLAEDIDRAKAAGNEYAFRRNPANPHSLEGGVAFHNETGLLVATGPEPFVDMVESIVTAWRDKERARSPVPPRDLPIPPGK